MAFQTGSGFSTKSDSYLAGKEAALSAIEGFSSKTEFVLLFCSGKYDPSAVVQGVIDVTQTTNIIGGAALGVFNNDHISYEGFECCVLAFSTDEMKFDTFVVPDISNSEKDAGEFLAKNVSTKLTESSFAMLVFYETTKSIQPPMLNFATPLFNAIDEVIPKSITIAGSGLFANMQLTNGFQFFNGEVVYNSAVAVLLSGNFRMETTIIHGCKPGSSYHTITDASGPVIKEIDNRPALDVISELLNPLKIEWKDFPLFVTLGVNKGEPFGPFKEENYANRLCLAVDEETKSMIMFEPDLKSGDAFQLMHRTVDGHYLKTILDSFMNKNDKNNILCHFYINCAGRALPYSGGTVEDVKELSKAINNENTFMGFYSGVEVARIQNKLQALDWTGVLCTFLKN